MEVIFDSMEEMMGYFSFTEKTSMVLNFIYENVKARMLMILFHINGIYESLMYPHRVIKKGKYHHMTYNDGRHTYSIVFKKKRGPHTFLNITDENGRCVMEEVKSYLGPGKNFYGIDTTPEMLGYKVLYFEYPEETKVFQQTEVIKV